MWQIIDETQTIRAIFGGCHSRVSVVGNPVFKVDFNFVGKVMNGSPTRAFGDDTLGNKKILLREIG